MRTKIAAGNWKMNMDFEEGIGLTKDLLANIGGQVPKDTKVILCPPYIHLSEMRHLLSAHSEIAMGAQNMYPEESGAFTGEISPNMLKSLNVEYVILGHSERREIFGEDANLLAKKVNLALSHDLVPIFCCGESQDLRENGDYLGFVKKQLEDSLFHLSDDDFKKVVIAYEPIWAIGTGLTASAEQAQEMHAELRKHIAAKYGEQMAQDTSILYGGSVKPKNADELFACEDVDGGLVGGASLKADDFAAITKALA